MALMSSAAAIIEIGMLVLREGLECILILDAIPASMTGSRRNTNVR
jgi:hypothetical protein